MFFPLPAGTFVLCCVNTMDLPPRIFHVVHCTFHLIPCTSTGGAQDTKKADKRMRYKDVVREQILGAETAEDAISSEEDSDNDDDAGIGRRGGRTFAYDDEQENLRKGFLGSIAKHEGGEGGDESDGQESGDDGDGLLKVKHAVLLLLQWQLSRILLFCISSWVFWRRRRTLCVIQ